MINYTKEKWLEMKQMFSSDAFLQAYDYDGRDLGAVYAKSQTVFKVWAPTASGVRLNLYKYGSEAEALNKHEADVPECYEMMKGARGTWSVSVHKNLEGVYYTYTVTIDGQSCETGDPYAKACGVNGGRSMVADMEETAPEGWEDDRHPADIEKNPVIYELHIKDFSNDENSGVRSEWRGKYLAFTETGTTFNGEGQFLTGLDYLKSLGVTYIHLLPSCDYGSIDESCDDKERYNWGYDPMNYNVPEGSYATDAFDGHVRIREFRAMVAAIHRAGLGVIMDVVYNHTYHMDTCLNKMVPGYYYRMYEDGTWANGSACGNDTASERKMFGRYMADSVCHWAKEYHIDGFRFDLMGLHDVAAMNEIRCRLNELENGEQILMYGEPWSASQTAWENDAVPAVTSNVHRLDEHIAIFSDRTRDAVKGSVFIEKETGYVNSNDTDAIKHKKDIKSAVCAWTGQGRDPGRMEPVSPFQVISYVSAHDDLTLWDKLMISVKDVPEYGKKDEEILQLNKMAAGIIFTCLGTPFFMAGEEFGRTKFGCSNSYNKSPKLNQLDWQRAKDYSDLTDYYRFMIRLRSRLPVLWRKDSKASEKIFFMDNQDAVIGFYMEDRKTYWHEAVVFYNPYGQGRRVLLPEGLWKLISDGVDIHEDGGAFDVKGEMMLKPKSVTILGRR